MDNTKKESINKKHNDRKISVITVGPVCVYCGTETEDVCCGEMHHELGFETIEPHCELLLESELTELHEIIE